MPAPRAQHSARLTGLLAAMTALGATGLALVPEAGPAEAWQGLAHAGAFAVIGLLFALALPGRPWGGLAAAALLGLAIELAQTRIPGRTASLGDLAANLAGLLAALALYAGLCRARASWAAGDLRPWR